MKLSNNKINLIFCFLGLFLLLSYSFSRHRNDPPSLSELEKRADKGDLDAILTLAYAYGSISGKGIVPGGGDPKIAAKWFRKGAELGSADCTVALTHFYSGKLSVPDLQQWLLRDANKGHKGAIVALSNAYQFGQFGFPVNLEQAKYWEEKHKEAAHREIWGEAPSKN